MQNLNVKSVRVLNIVTHGEILEPSICNLAKVASKEGEINIAVEWDDGYVQSIISKFKNGVVLAASTPKLIRDTLSNQFAELITYQQVA